MDAAVVVLGSEAGHPEAGEAFSVGGGDLEEARCVGVVLERPQRDEDLPLDEADERTHDGAADVAGRARSGSTVQGRGRSDLAVADRAVDLDELRIRIRYGTRWRRSLW